MKHISFRLSMPHRGSWNNKWSGDSGVFVRVKTYSNKDFNEKNLNKLINKNFYYRWNDGWEACVSVRLLSNSKEKTKLEKMSNGFCGYDWMIESILNFGEIK